METLAHRIVNEADKFEAYSYPDVASEIDSLQLLLSGIKGVNKASIVISFLRDHSIKTQWLNDNKQLVWMLTSDLMQASHVELLFNSSKHNSDFISSFEAYMRTKLT